MSICRFPRLWNGHVGRWFLSTETNEDQRPIDLLSLTIESASETIESFYGWPTGNENNGC